MPSAKRIFSKPAFLLVLLSTCILASSGARAQLRNIRVSKGLSVGGHRDKPATPELSVSACSTARSIEPCTCQDETFKFTISCAHGLTLNHILRALNQTYRTRIIPQLTLSDSYIFELPSKAFQSVGIFPKKLHIEYSHLRYIAEDAFSGLEHVTSLLVLRGDKLYFVPTEALRTLSNLQTLSLTDNLITEIRASSFQGMRKLQFLSLNGNRISTMERGSLNRELKQLSLANNHIYSLNNTLKGLKNLRWLFLDNNRLTSLKGELKGLTNLKWLSIANNLIEHIGDAFQDLHNLTHLQLFSNNIHHLGSSLQPLTSLATLNLSKNALEHISEAEFQGLTNLQILDLSDNHLSYFRTVSTLRGLHIQTLNLSNNALVHVDLGALLDVKSVDLSHNILTTLEGGAFPNSDSLQRLVTSRIDSDNHIGSLQTSLPMVKYVQTWDLDGQVDKHRFRKHGMKLKKIKLEGNPLKCDFQLTKLLANLQMRQVQITGGPLCTERDINEV